MCGVLHAGKQIRSVGRVIGIVDGALQCLTLSAFVPTPIPWVCGATHIRSRCATGLSPTAALQIATKCPEEGNEKER